MGLKMNKKTEKNNALLSRISKHKSILIATPTLALGVCVGLLWNQQINSRSTITQLNQQQAQLQIKLNSNNQFLLDKLHDKELAVTNLKQEVTQLLTKSLESDRNQSLNRAKFFIEEAKYSLNIDYDFDHALKLLNAAKQISQSVNEPLLETEISNHIHTITNIKNKLNYSVIIHSIDTVTSEVNALPEEPLTTFTPKPEPTKTTKTDSKLNRVLSGFKNLVVIKHRSQPIEPLLTANEIKIIKNNISIKATEAQWALLRHQQATYSSSISNMIKQLNKLPPQSNSAAILKQLKSLQSISVSPTIPTFKTVLATLSQLQPKTTGLKL